jgi:hypothetical protein
MRELRILVILFGLFLVLPSCSSDGDDDDDSGAGDDDAVGDDDDAVGDDDDAVGDDDDAVGDDDDAVGDDDDASGPVVTATVTVPAGFDDVPVKLFVGYMDSFAEGNIEGHGLELDSPDIGDGNPLDIVAIHDDLAGEYVIVVVLYVEGGAPKGEGWPVEGVDHVWYAEGQTLGSGDIALGTIEVIPWVTPQ